jgi:hypothetical protein
VAATAGGPARTADRHGQAAQDERLGQRGQEGVIGDRPGVVQQRFRAGAGQGHRESVDRFGPDAVSQLPVGDGVDVAEGVADAGLGRPVRPVLHEVEVDDDGDRDVHPVRAADALVVQRRHGRGDAVVGQAGRHRHHRDGEPRGGVLGGVDGLAAADPDDRVVGALAQFVAEFEGGIERSAADGEQVGPAKTRAYQFGDPLALARADDDCDVAAAGDPPVGQQQPEIGDRPASNLDRERRVDRTG